MNRISEDEESDSGHVPTPRQLTASAKRRERESARSMGALLDTQLTSRADERRAVCSVVALMAIGLMVLAILLVVLAPSDANGVESNATSVYNLTALLPTDAEEGEGSATTE